MKNIILFILLFITLESYSQPYTPLNIDSTSMWVYDYEQYAAGIKVLGEKTSIVIGDTIISGNLYHNIFTYPSGYPIVYDSSYLGFYYWPKNNFIREDTLLHKVFQYNSLSGSDDVVLDFNLNVGDTMPLSGYLSPMAFLVDSIGWGNVLGINRKFQYSHYTASVPYYATIEGIGSSSNFPADGHGEWGIPMYTLKCYTKNGIKLYGDSLTACVMNFPLELQSYFSSDVELKIINNNVKIVNPNGEHLNLSVFDLKGSVLYSENINSNSNKCELNNLASGLYICKLQGLKTHITRKILIE